MLESLRIKSYKIMLVILGLCFIQQVLTSTRTVTIQNDAVAAEIEVIEVFNEKPVSDVSEYKTKPTGSNIEEKVRVNSLNEGIPYKITEGV